MKKVVLVLFLAGLILPWTSSGQGSRLGTDGRPMICHNRTLVEAIQLIDRACSDLSCNLSALEELDARVDKKTLLFALRDPYLFPVHIFFPSNESRLENSFDWSSVKKAQLASLVGSVSDPRRAVIFVLGHASATGGISSDRNIRLSRERMEAVRNHLRDVLRIDCQSFHGAWFSNTVLQLTKSDAALLGLARDDYRDDELVLNQAVHVFIFPCVDVL